jgi:hypothetical protein
MMEKDVGMKGAPERKHFKVGNLKKGITCNMIGFAALP